MWLYHHVMSQWALNTIQEEEISRTQENINSARCMKARKQHWEENQNISVKSKGLTLEVASYFILQKQAGLKVPIKKKLIIKTICRNWDRRQSSLFTSWCKKWACIVRTTQINKQANKLHSRNSINTARMLSWMAFLCFSSNKCKLLTRVSLFMLKSNAGVTWQTDIWYPFPYMTAKYVIFF